MVQLGSMSRAAAFSRYCLRFLQSNYSFPKSFPDPNLTINLQACLSFWCLYKIPSLVKAVPRQYPQGCLEQVLYLNGVRYFVCMGLLDWKDYNTKIQLESPPAIWASLNIWQILSSQCSTARQQLKDLLAAGERSVREAAELHKSDCLEAWGGIKKCCLTLNVLNRSDNPFDYSWKKQKSGWVEHLAALLWEFWIACWRSGMPLWSPGMPLWSPNGYLKQKPISKTSKRCVVN